MAFVYLYTKDGTTPQTKYYPAAEVTFTKGEPCYWDTGVVTNATYSSIYTNTIVGIVEETKTCTSGDLIPVQVNRSAIYKATASDTCEVANVGKNVLLSAIGTIASDTEAVDKTGVFKIEKRISDTYAEVSINFAPPSDQA